MQQPGATPSSDPTSSRSDPLGQLPEQIRELLRQRGPRCGQVTIVAVDGPSGAGKTTVASGIAAAIDARVVHVDDMHQGWSGLRETVERARDTLIGPWSRGAQGTYPTWDWDRGEPGPDRPLQPPQRVVLEGVGAFAIAGEQATARVWLDADTDVRKRRALTRDGQGFADHWDEWAAQEREVIHADHAQDRADIRIDTSVLPTPASTDARSLDEAAAPPPRPSLALIVLAVAGVALSLRTLMSALPPLLDRIGDDLGLSSTWLGVLTTLPVLSMGLLAPSSAALARRIGSAQSIAVAMAAIAMGNLARGLDGVAALYLGTLCAGAGIALAGTILPGLVKDYFPAERAGLATGVQMLAMMSGAGVAAAAAVPLADALGRWTYSLAVWGVVAVVGQLAWLPMVRNARRRTTELADTAHGLPWRHSTAWLVTAYLAAQSWQFYSSLAWLSPTYVDHGWSARDSGLLLSAFTGAQLVSGLIAPALADRVSDWRVLLLAASALGLVGELGVWLLPDVAPWVWSLSLGLGQGACFALGLVLLVRYAVSSAASARLTAMAFFVSYTVAALGPTTMGALRDVSGSPGIIWASLVVVMVAQLALCVALRPSRPQIR